MDYRDSVRARIQAAVHRSAEREALWEAIATAFETRGADGVKDAIARRMGALEHKFDATLKNVDHRI